MSNFERLDNVKTYEMENTSRGYEPRYEMIESVDHKGLPDGLGTWVRREDIQNKAEPVLRNPMARRTLPNILAVLQFYMDAFPAFRSKPVGAPNSIERRAQETHIEWEDKARALLTPPSGEAK